MYAYDALLNKKNIPSLPKNKIRKNIYFININTHLIDKINKYLVSNEKDINILHNAGRGNCFHKSISRFYFNFVEDYHIYYRKEIASFLDSIKTTIIIESPYIYKNEYTWGEYFN